MSDIEWTKDEIFWESEEIEDEYTGDWRWGTTRTRVFLKDGVTYACDYSLQPEEGIVDYGTPYEVELVKKTTVVETWVKVKK